MESQASIEGIYEMPTFSVNEFGWGPSSVPEQFEELPFSLFSRDDSLGTIGDLSAISSLTKNSGGEGEEGDFTVIESSRAAVPRKQKLIHTKTNRTYSTTPTNATNATNNKTRSQQKKNATQYQRRNYDSLHIPSIPIKSSWKSVYQVEFSDLAKMTTKEIPKATTFAECGSFNMYKNAFNNIDAKKPVLLEKHPECGDLKPVSVLKDPFLMQLSETNAATIYTTDVALSYIMAVTRSQLSWDLEIVKNEKGLFISHRDNAFDLYHVNETSADLPTEEENKDDCLRKEVTDINRDFLKQIMTDECTACAYPSPFDSSVDSDPTKIHQMYRYQKYTMGDDTLLVRTSVHGKQNRGGKVSTFNAYAINEWCDRTPLTNRWRPKLASSSIFPIIEDMKNNNFRLSRWGVQAMLAAVENVKVGYVTRKNMKTHEDGHNLLSVQNFSLDLFTKQIMLNEKSMWAITEHFIKILNNQEDGNYIMMKDPMKGMIRIYRVSEDDLTKIEEESGSGSGSEGEYSGSEYSGSEYSGSEYSGSEYSESEYSDEE